MFKIFRGIDQKCKELEQMRVLALTGEIMYRQKGEYHVADRFKKAEKGLAEAIRILTTSVEE